MIQAYIKKRLNGQNGTFCLDVNLNIAEGEFVALYGPSGVGKTTLLRCLAGLEQPDEATIKFHNQVWSDTASRVNLAPQLRKIGYMFQDYALFPNMTVRENLEFALRKGGNKQRVSELIEMMNLGELQHQKSDYLSGGQKQRVALARTLVSEPCLLLLDEPFAALDSEIRNRLQAEVLRLQKGLGITTIIVSHNVSEIYKLSTRVLKMQDGKVTQDGMPSETFNSGYSSGKFRFIGEILAIENVDVLSSVTVLVGNQIVKVVAMPVEAANFSVGESVMMVSKAFNPMVMKL